MFSGHTTLETKSRIINHGVDPDLKWNFVDFRRKNRSLSRPASREMAPRVTMHSATNPRKFFPPKGEADAFKSHSLF